MSHLKISKILSFFVIFLVCTALALFAWLFFHQKSVFAKEKADSLQSTNHERERKVYTDNQNGFSLLVPEGWRGENCKEIDCLILFHHYEGLFENLKISVRPIQPTYNAEKAFFETLSPKGKAENAGKLQTEEGQTLFHSREEVGDKALHTFFVDTKRGKTLRVALLGNRETEKEFLKEAEASLKTLRIYPGKGALKLNVFLTKLEKGQMCDSVFVPMNLTVEKGDSEELVALDTLLSLKDLETTDPYNALSYSSLRVQDLQIKDEKATVNLEGSLVAGGECDLYRITQQIKNTLMQFGKVKEVTSLYKGKALHEYFK